MLDKKVAVYIPSTVNGNQPAPAAKIARWVREAKIALASLFGGFTAYNGEGGWYSPEHGLIEEKVTIVQAFTDEAGLERVGKLRELAKEMASDMGQEAVSLEVNGTLNFVTA